jgi:hypothetical protein
MMRARRLRKWTAILAAAAGIVLATNLPASAATGVDGFTILNAHSSAQAHKCNVIGEDTEYQAVVCADLFTSEYAGDYYVIAGGEAYCQYTAAPHDLVPCKAISDYVSLSTGDGGKTAQQSGICNTRPVCPDYRVLAQTVTWDYSVAAATGNDVCSTKPGSAYNVWAVIWGGETSIQVPDGNEWILGQPSAGSLPANDGTNESTGHYYVCP